MTAVKKKVVIMAGFGFLLGMAMMLIVPAVINCTPIGGFIYSAQLLERLGSPAKATLLTLLVMGLFGSACMVGTLFYQIERWPLALATAAHYLTVSLGYLIPVRVLCWEMSLRLLLMIEGMMTLGFFLIWLMLYLRYKDEVRKLNKLLQEQSSADDRLNQ